MLIILCLTFTKYRIFMVEKKVHVLKFLIAVRMLYKIPHNIFIGFLLGN